jgi:hypothetical protein
MTLEVLLGKPGERRAVRAELVKRSALSVWVKLPDGNVVKRKIKRDVPSLRGEWYTRGERGGKE